MKENFSPRKKDIYIDEYFTVLPKRKEITPEYFSDADDLETLDKFDKLDEFDVLDKSKIPFYAKPRSFNEDLEPDGTVSLKGIFRELDEERKIRLAKQD